MDENPNRETPRSVIDAVLPETGSRIPDGGYGWIVFAATLFFQIFIPSLIVVYGILLASVKLDTNIDDKEILYLWDDKLAYVPLLFTSSWIIFEPTARKLISHSTWPRYVGQAGICLTCAGLLFVWMGMAGNNDGYVSDQIWLILAGIVSGMGSSILVSQCEILLAQYFKLKHLYLTHLTHMFVALGFMITPMLVSYLRMKLQLLQVLLIYQSFLMLGIIVNSAFKKPEYLKSKLVRYHYVTENAEDEEDIFSKSLTELKLKTKDMLKRIELKNDTIVEEDASPSAPSTSTSEVEHNKENWVKFDEARGENWEKFDETDERKYEQINPAPLFNDSVVNMNTTYAFDEDNLDTGPRSIPTVFPEIEKNSKFTVATYLKIIKLPTFYKSLLTIITTKYSIFIFYTLFPSYIYVQVSHLRFRRSAQLIGCLSIGTLIFSGFSYWLNVNKQKRPIFLFLLCWIGANGYFLIATYKHNEYVVLFGALEIVLSIASLQHIGGPLLGLTLRGEGNAEYAVLSLLTGLSFFIFLILDVSYKDCFLMMALLHIITGLVWISNYFYKKLRIIN